MLSTDNKLQKQKTLLIPLFEGQLQAGRYIFGKELIMGVSYLAANEGSRSYVIAFHGFPKEGHALWNDHLNIICIGIPQGIYLLWEYPRVFDESSVHDFLPFLSRCRKRQACRKCNSHPSVAV